MRRVFLLLGWLVCGVGSVFGSDRALSARGITEPFLEVVLSAPVPGIIGSHQFKEGDLVKTADLVLELDNKLEGLEVQRREAVLPTLKSDLDGTRFLFEQPTSSVKREDLMKKELEYKIAVLDWELAKEQLRRRQIISPIDGYITEYFLEVGEACEAQRPLVKVVDTRRCYFVSNVEARQGHRLKAGDQVPLEIEAGEGSERFVGTISYVSPVVDPASGLMKVKVLFENAEGKIRPGVAGTMVLGKGAHGN